MRLAPQPLKVLAVLASRAGELVTRDELKAQLWGDNTFIEFDQGLNTCIRQIRTVLGDDADVPRFIETLPRRGYRMLVAVEHLDGDPVQPTAAATPPIAPSERHSAPASTHGWLRWSAAAASLLIGVAVIVSLAGWPSRTIEPPPRPTVPTLAVLPLTNLSNDPAHDYLADGITESLIHDLAQIRALRVVSRTSVMRYRKTALPIATIASELGATLIVEGSIQPSADRARVTIQLIDAMSDRHLFSRTFDTTADRLFDTQREIARQVAREVSVQITPAERERLEATRHVDAAAYRNYLLGRHFWNRRTLEALRTALSHFKAALDIDPRFADAHAAVAQTYVLLGDEEYSGMPTNEASRLTHDAAAKALSLDPTLAAAHAARALARFQFDWDWPGAEQEFQRALALDPNSATTHGWYGWYLLSQARFDEAIAEMRRAREFDPLSLTSASSLGDFYYFAGRNQDALAAYDAALALDPNYAGALIWRGRVLEALGRHNEALAQYERVLASTFDLRADVGATRVMAALGDLSGARARVAATRQRGAFLPSTARAYQHFALGEIDLAFSALQQAVDERSSSLLYLLVSPIVDNIRPDARFVALIRRVNPALEHARRIDNRRTATR